MKYFGLHWVSSDGRPLQIRVDTSSLEIWARSNPKGGEWTAWRRLDVRRLGDGTLAEKALEATSAKNADAADKLATPVRLELSGDAAGSCVFDGANNAKIELALTESGAFGKLKTKYEDLEKKLASVEGKLDYWIQVWQKQDSNE